MDDAKLIGAYASREDADAAVDRLRGQQGFRDHPAGWLVEPYRLNVDHWETGFSTLPAANLILLHSETAQDGRLSITVSAETERVDCQASAICTALEIQDFRDRCAADPLVGEVVLSGDDADGRFVLRLVPGNEPGRVAVTLTTESAPDASAEVQASVSFQVTDRDVAHFVSRLRHVVAGSTTVAALRSSLPY